MCALRLRYSTTTLFTCDGIVQLKTGWAQDAWMPLMYENWYFLLAISGWLTSKLKVVQLIFISLYNFQRLGFPQALLQNPNLHCHKTIQRHLHRLCRFAQLETDEISFWFQSLEKALLIFFFSQGRQPAWPRDGGLGALTIWGPTRFPLLQLPLLQNNG